MNKKNILIVEDDKSVSAVLGMTLKLWRYNVVGVATSGQEAIQKAIEQHPDLVIMDVVLTEEMSGDEAGQRISDDLNIPVIYVTAYQKKFEELKKHGKIHLLKPYTNEDLKKAISTALQPIKSR